METPQIPIIDIGTLGNASSDGDIELLDMEFDIVEDIPAELEDFIFLARLGLFEEAHELFEQVLKPHDRYFPVLAEFADMLLEEGRYAELSRLLTNPSAKAEFSEDECQLLDLMKALSEAHIEQLPNQAKEQLDDAKPKLKFALNLAQNWHKGWLKASHSFSGLEVRSVITLFWLHTHMARCKF
jgi:tetratricopeptide (TPR) repeat protein